jgi:hypothetical protein
MTGGEESWLERQARIVAQFSLLAEECLQRPIWTLLKEARFCATEIEADHLSPTISTSTPPPTQEAPQSSSPLFRSDSNAEVGMRTIEDIISEAQKTLGRSFQEAFDAGRDHVASELKRRMAVLFEDLAGSDGSTTGEHTNSSPHESQHSDPGNG